MKRSRQHNLNTAPGDTLASKEAGMRQYNNYVVKSTTFARYLLFAVKEKKLN